MKLARYLRCHSDRMRRAASSPASICKARNDRAGIYGRPRQVRL